MTRRPRLPGARRLARASTRLSAPILAVLLAGCAGEPTTTEKAPVRVPADTAYTVPQEPVETPFSIRIEQAEMRLAQRQLLPAASMLSTLDWSSLTADERARVLAMEVELLHLQGDSSRALARLSEQAPLLSGIRTERREALDDWQLRLLAAVDGPLAVAMLADRLAVLSEDKARSDSLNARVWENLQRTPVALLQARLESEQSQHWRGWLELALLAADVMESPPVQAAQLALWQERYPAHPAAEALPGGMGTLADSAANPPGRIALLLPLSSGPTDSGRAALEGFLAAQYLARRRGWPEQQLMIMDSSDFPDLGSAATSAARAGAELVIGPLTPEIAQDWRPDTQASVPMLTLTWLPPQPPASTLPVQLSLAPEDEARQLARLAFDSGARSALVVRPEGDWGERVSSALVDAWQQLEGEVRALAVYSGQADYSTSLKAALQLAESEARASRIRRLLAEPTEFFPRRRRDLDVIFMLTEQSQQARSLKPLFAFHYAGDLPVYATSHVFSGRRDPQRDRDLNDVRMLETPYLLEQPVSPLPALLREAGGDEELADMHALGADAFMLNWRLAQLRSSPEARIRGQTGLLSIDAGGRVHRELTPAVMREGLPAPD